MTITKLKIAGENDKLGVVHYHPTFGYDKYKTKGSILINQPNAEKCSKGFYNAVIKNKAATNWLDDIKEDYKVLVSHRVVDPKEGDNSNVSVPVCHLVLTSHGLIHLTHIPFKGRVTGKETTDWMLWGNARSKNFCSLNKPLFTINDKVISPLQNLVKVYLTRDEVEDGLSYVRNIIVFDAGSEVVIYNSKKSKDTDLEFLSTQVATTETVKSVIDAYYYNTNGTRRTGEFSLDTYKALENVLNSSEIFRSKDSVVAYFTPDRVELIDFSDDEDNDSAKEPKKVGKSKVKEAKIEAEDKKSANTKDSVNKEEGTSVSIPETIAIEVKAVDIPPHKVLKKVKIISGANKEDLEKTLNELLLEEDYHEVEMRGDLCSCILKQYK
ncbi:hypothetical protein D3C81_11150 [compost metagenome]